MKRIQRKRTKGWKMPGGVKYVGRPTKWGNPIKVVGGMLYIDAGFRRKHLDKWVLLDHDGYDEHSQEDAVELFREIIEAPTIRENFDNYAMYYWYRHFKNLDWDELKGWKYLACWCPLDKPCHADVLIDKS